MKHSLLWAAALVATACGDAAMPPAIVPSTTAAPATTIAAPPPAITTEPAKLLDADTPMAIGSASITAPKGWLAQADATMTRLEAPEHDATMWLFETTGADAQAVIVAAWKKASPDFTRSPKRKTTIPARDGWDETVQVDYDKGSSATMALGLARRKGETWYVSLLEATPAAMERRAAQINGTILAFRPPGVVEESFADRTAHPLDEARARALATFVEDARKEAGIPGVAVAVVQNGHVVFERGFGVKDARKKSSRAADRVTPTTLFMIGSTTKSLTTLMMARLVDKGAFEWTTPAATVLPSFGLGDADLGKKLTMKQTVCACTGLPRQDMEMLFEYAHTTAEERIGTLRGMKPTTALGETFQYSNTMVAAGGYAAAHAADAKHGLGPAYDESMRRLVLRPLGMNATTMDQAAALRADHATPHARARTNELVPIAPGDEGFVVPVRPAGGAWSNVRDMEHYLALELANGKLAGGKTFVSEANLLVRREPQVKVNDHTAYGLGLFVERDHGVPVIHHGGNTMGFTSDMFFLPGHDVGVIVLTNAGAANAFRSAVRRRVLEILFDGKEQAAGDLHESVARSRKADGADALLDARVDPATVADLLGDYEEAGLGKATVRFEKQELVFDAGEWKSRAAIKRGAAGKDMLVLLDPPHLGFSFTIATEGKRTLTLETGQQKYVFLRQN